VGHAAQVPVSVVRPIRRASKKKNILTAHLGSTSDYCGTGCQKDFGTCNVPKKIDGVGTFIHTEDYTFSANAAFPSGLHKSTEFHEDTKNPDLKAKYDQQYTPDNAKVVGDTLALYVQGPPHQNPVKCGQVTTINQKIMYGSFKVRAKLSNEPGVVNGKRTSLYIAWRMSII